MLSMFTPRQLSQIYRDPIAGLILAVDLFPLWAILVLGWRAEPLVMLYWLENLIIGAVALTRMVLAGKAMGSGGVALIAILAPFFILHYGIFCYVHGTFIYVLMAMPQNIEPVFLGPIGLVEQALQSGPWMPLFVLTIIGLQAVLIWRDYLLTGAYQDADIKAEMSAPYGRIVILHIAIFAGVAALIFLDEPLIGILALLGLRVLWGIYFTAKRQISRDSAAHKKVDAPS